MREVFNFQSGGLSFRWWSAAGFFKSFAALHKERLRAADFLPGLLSITIAVSCFFLHRVPFQFYFGQIQETKELTGLLRSFAVIKLSLNRVTQLLKVASLCYFLSNIDHSTLIFTLPQTLATFQFISLWRSDSMRPDGFSPSLEAQKVTSLGSHLQPLTWDLLQ